MDDEEVETLVTAAATGDEVAWQRLWAVIEPSLSRIVAQPRFLGRLGRNEDDRNNIVVAVMGRLRADSFNRLKLYVDARTANPKLKFLSWLRVVAKRVGIDYLRAHPDYVRRHDAGASKPGEWANVGTLPPASQLFGNRPPVTMLGTARALLDSAEGDQRRAVELWLQSEDYDGIAAAMKLASARDAERLVRAALERMRRKFRPDDGTT